MKKIPKCKTGTWYTPRVHASIRRVFKKKFKERISTPEINSIWTSYLEEEIINNLQIGAIVNIDKKTKIWVKAIPVTEHKRAMALLSKGLMYVGKRIKEADISFDSSQYIYKIMLESERFNGGTQLFFKPHKNLSNSVNEGIKKGKLITRTKCQ